MAERILEILLKSATDLKKVNKSKMHPYVVAWIDSIVRVPGPVDKSNGSNPVWNSTITMSLTPRMLEHPVLNIELLGLGFLSTKPIGSVVIDLADIIQQGASGAAVDAEFHNHQMIKLGERKFRHNMNGQNEDYRHDSCYTDILHTITILGHEFLQPSPTPIRVRSCSWERTSSTGHSGTPAKSEMQRFRLPPRAPRMISIR